MYILFIIIISCISHLLNGIYTYIFTVILIYLFDDDWFPTEGNATPSDAGPFSFHLFWGELLPAGPLLVGWQRWAYHGNAMGISWDAIGYLTNNQMIETDEMGDFYRCPENGT